MRVLATAFAFVAAVIATPVVPQTPATAGERASEVLFTASSFAVSKELGSQFPRLFESGLPPEQLDQLRVRLEYFPERVREAMEQRWTPRETPPLPPELQAVLNEILGSSRAGRRGELGAQRPPTRGLIVADLTRRFDETQLAEIAVFLETPAGAELTRSHAAGVVRRQAPRIGDLPEEHRVAAQAFADTPSGRAYMRALQPLTQMIVEELRLNTMEHGRELMTEVAVAYCEVAPECASGL